MGKNLCICYGHPDGSESTSVFELLVLVLKQFPALEVTSLQIKFLKARCRNH